MTRICLVFLSQHSAGRSSLPLIAELQASGGGILLDRLRGGEFQAGKEVKDPL